ncbi:unnamed protein product [Camellia sinensis]
MTLFIYIYSLCVVVSHLQLNSRQASEKTKLVLDLLACSCSLKNYTYTYIYIYIYRERERERDLALWWREMGKIANTIHGLKPAMMMVVVQAALAGNSIFYKLASSIGMSMRVLIAYRFVIAVAFIVPLALLLERRRPKLTWKVTCQACLIVAYLGSMAQNLYAEGFVLTSATFAAALYNLIPACTFILAVFFRMERLGLGTTIGKMKVAGTLMCIGGAMLLIFYKGVELNISSTNVDLLHHKGGHVATLHPHDSNNVVGALLVVSCCVSVAIGLIVQNYQNRTRDGLPQAEQHRLVCFSACFLCTNGGQLKYNSHDAKMIQDYPCVYSSTALMMTMAAIQAIGFALCMDRDWSKWKLGWNLRLLTVSYSGIVASGVTFTLMAWCVQIRGPLFVSIFSPVMLVLVAIAGLLLLDEKLHLGSVLGAGVIVCGLYIVLKGKSKELKRITQLMPSKSSKESEHIDIIVTSLTENNNGSSDNIIVVEEEEEEEVSSEVEGVFNLDQMSSHEIVAI